MLNIMKSELYKMIHRRCTYVFLGVFVGGGFFMNLLLKVLLSSVVKVNLGDEIMDFWGEVVVAFTWFIVYMIAQIIYSNESKIGVSKNTISFGISRTKMYVSRFLTQLVVLVAATVVVTGSVVLGNLVFNSGCSATRLGSFVRLVASMEFLWVGALAFAHMLSSCLNSNSIATVIYMLYFFLGKSIIQMAHMALNKNEIITFMYNNEISLFASRVAMEDKVAENLLNYILIGGVYFIVFFGLGLFIYRRKEVK